MSYVCPVVWLLNTLTTRLHSIPSSPTNLNYIIMHVRITNMKIYRREKVERVSVDDGWVRIAHAGRVTNISPIDNQDLHKEFGFKIY